jgi:hypothetical protein
MRSFDGRVKKFYEIVATFRLGFSIISSSKDNKKASTLDAIKLFPHKFILYKILIRAARCLAT